MRVLCGFLSASLMCVRVSLRSCILVCMYLYILECIFFCVRVWVRAHAFVRACLHSPSWGVKGAKGLSVEQQEDRRNVRNCMCVIAGEELKYERVCDTTLSVSISVCIYTVSMSECVYLHYKSERVCTSTL